MHKHLNLYFHYLFSQSSSQSKKLKECSTETTIYHIKRSFSIQMSLPTIKDLGHLNPHETFSISTPSVRVVIAGDLINGMIPGKPHGKTNHL